MKKLFVILILFSVISGGYWWKNHRSTSPAQQKEAILYYTCPMHKFVHSEKPGKCPVCSMDLVPVMKEDAEEAHPEGTSVEPPEVLKGLGEVKLTPFKEQMIGVKLAKVGSGPVIRLIRTVGRFAGGGEDFAALAGDFASQGEVKPSGARYVVADVYALDQPFVKVGQKAWISSFSGTGSKIEGRVAQVFPYDGTQSRVMRVRVNLMGPVVHEIFANVEIEAAAPARFLVPREAVMHTGTQAYVFIRKDVGRFAPKLVTVGFEGDDSCEIIKGLNAGDEVVWGGNFMIDADAHLNAGTGDKP